MSVALIISALGGLAVASGIAIAAAHPGHDGGEMTRTQAAEKAGEHFARMDANNDGKLDRADREAAHARMAADMFARVDADKDGSISRDEWNAGAAQIARGGGESHARHALRMQRPAMMMRADADGDRAISRAEFETQALERFDRADADKDGKISVSEREQAHAAMRERSGRR